MGEGRSCGSVGRAVASDTTGLQFKSSHWQKFIYIEHLFTVNCILKRQNKEKEAGNGPFKKKQIWVNAQNLKKIQKIIRRIGHYVICPVSVNARYQACLLSQ